METVTLDAITKQIADNTTLAVHLLKEGQLEKAEKLLEACSGMVWKYRRLVESLQTEEIL